MPSYVNFQPLIDASRDSVRLKQQAAQERGRSMERGVQMATQALDIIGQRGRSREKEFESIFDYDLNKNASKEARAYLANKYRQIKRDGVNMFKGNKNFLGYGKLTPEQRIQLDDELDSFKREAELLNVINQQIGNAEKLGAQRPHAINVDREKIGRYLQLLKPDSNGRYDTEGLAEFIAESSNSSTGQPFTSYGEFDPDFHLDQSRGMIKKELKPIEMTEELVVDRGGKRISETRKKTSYGTEDERRNKYYEMLSSSKDQDLYEFKIGEQLSEDERESAIAEYGNKVANPMSAYYAFDKADMSKGFEDTQVLAKRKTAPAPKTSKDGRDYMTVKETDIGWEFGTTPIAITKEIEGETFKNASVVAVKKDDSGNYMAEMVVPRGKNESFANIVNMRADQEGRDLTNTESAAILQEMLNDDRVKTIQVPLESIYDELKVGFGKKKLNLEGYETISFDQPEEVNWDEYLR